MNIINITVLDQTTIMGGRESCGYHTLKNSLIALMYQQELIDLETFKRLLVDPKIFIALYRATVVRQTNQNEDVTISQFMDTLKKVKQGKLHWSEFGLSQEKLTQLRLKPDGNQQISVANFSLIPGDLPYGLLGMEEDLLNAAAIAQLARSKGKMNHVFALGINNRHWVTVALHQNDKGVRTWQLMDSWKNQTKYRDAINHIESLLITNESELRHYLKSAYLNASDLLNRNFKEFFDTKTGLVLPAKFNQAKAYFIENKQTQSQYMSWIVNRFKFFTATHMFLDAGDEEKALMKQLFHVSDFIRQHAGEHETDVKTQLTDICQKLHQVVFAGKVSKESKKVENISSPIVREPRPQSDHPIKRLVEGLTTGLSLIAPRIRQSESLKALIAKGDFPLSLFQAKKSMPDSAQSADISIKV